MKRFFSVSKKSKMFFGKYKNKKEAEKEYAQGDKTILDFLKNKEIKIMEGKYCG